MKNVLLTGATGNIGRELISQLCLNNNVKIIAGVRNKKSASHLFKKYDNLEYRNFDFEKPTSFSKAFDNIDIVFLLRPPHISDIQKFFYPLLKEMKDRGISKIVFLSVQGAEKSKIIPHNKIETLIKSFNFTSIILRPSYFMQNLTTTLYTDVINRQIVLPSGKAEFNWIDILDIAEVAAEVIVEFDQYKGQVFELTGSENLSFIAITKKIGYLMNLNIAYKNVSPFKFYRMKKKEGMARANVLVLLFLHFLPRFEEKPKFSRNVEKIVNHPPQTLNDFILRNKDYFIGDRTK